MTSTLTTTSDTADAGGPHNAQEKIVLQGSAMSTQIPNHDTSDNMSKGVDEEMKNLSNEKEPRISDGSISSSSTLMVDASNSTVLKLRVEKDHALGLLIPQNQRYFLKSLHPSTNADLGLLFVTGKCHYVDVLSGLPPPFEIFSADEGQQSALVSRVLPHGWQGITSCKASLDVAVGDGKTVKWEIKRLGMFANARTYDLRRNPHAGEPEEIFTWKGSNNDIKDIKKKAKQGGEKTKRVHKGNLKLVDSSGQVLALWQQLRSSNLLGDLMVLQSAKGRLSMETIVTSCLTIVMTERATGYNWVGGLGSRSKTHEPA